MPAAELETAGEAPAPVEALARQPKAAELTRLAGAARAGRMSAADTRRLQRMIGNRAVTRILARADSKDARPMQDAAHKADERLKSPSGHEMVWDAFDRTATIFMPKDGPNPEGAVQLVYNEGTPEELAKMPNLGLQSAVGLSKVRAQILEFLRANQGTYQTETDEDAKKRAAIGATLCNAFLGAVTGSLFSTTLGGMNPRADAIAAGRGGAFHTLADREDGPQPGDVIAYGKVEPARAKGELRRANFTTVTHVGFFKSRRKSPDNKEIWTVVDGGQPDPMATKRNIVQERTRTFTREELKVQIPSRFATETKMTKDGRTLYVKGSPIDYEKGDGETMTCGVLKSKYADAGQNADDKLLRGWLDVDEFYGGGAAPAVTGANNKVFVGNDPVKNGAAALGAVAQ
jgi:hypothetical protein